MSSNIVFTTFDWKERDDARKFVEKMRRKGMTVYIAETEKDSYDLITLDSRFPADIGWWQDKIQDMLGVPIRPVDPRLDECGSVRPSGRGCPRPVRRK